MTRTTSLLFAFTLAACASGDTKIGPEEGDASSESTISTYYTTIVGTLALGETLPDSIHYPDYYLGRTVVLRAGQSVKLVVAGSAKSSVQFYGPAHTFTPNGEPRFRQAMVTASTKKVGTKHTVTLGVTAPKDGTYMLVYGPDHVWSATYQTTATCTASCELVAEEGEACEGFVPAELFATCEPNLDCVAPHDIISDVQGNCGQEVTVSQLLANPAHYNGRYVAVRGEIQMRPPACTKIRCPDTNLCCNTCHASLNLFVPGADPTTSEGIYLTEAGEPVSCSGKSCDYQNHCTLEGGTYWLSGWFSLAEGVAPMLDIVRRYEAP